MEEHPQTHQREPEAMPAASPAPAPQAAHEHSGQDGLTPPWQLLKHAWEIYQAKLGTMLGLAAIPTVVTILGMVFVGASIIVGKAAGGDGAALASLGGSAIIFVLVMIVASILSTSGMVMVTKHRTEAVSFSAALKMAWPFFFSYLLVAVITGLIVAVGFLLLIVPGIIFALWYGMSSYAVLDQGKKGWAALQESKRLVSKRLKTLLVRYGVIILVALGIKIAAAIVASILGSKIGPVVSQIAQWGLTPLPVIYYYLVYEEFKRTRPA